MAFHTFQVVDANWKTTQEAFLEGYHVSNTHQHTLRFANDFYARYDVFGENVSPVVSALALPVTHLIGQVPQAELAGVIQKMLPREDRHPIPDDSEYITAEPY